MLSYEAFFIIILFSILGPVVGLLFIIFFNMLEQEVHILEMQNRGMYLETELQKSEYMQLTSQIEPHFLFNALNSLLSLTRLKRFDQLVISFEHLIRYLRYNYQAKEQLHPLYQEIDHTRNYVAIQLMRFGPRLQVNWDVDPILSNAVIPPYLLQTLVENAFKHGLEQVEGDALLQIRLHKTVEIQTDFVCLEVKDNGPGFDINPLVEESPAQGIGLHNVQKRLRLLFLQKASLHIVCNSECHLGGLIVAKWPLINKET